MIRIRAILSGLAGLLAVALAALPARAQDIVETISKNPDLSGFLDLVKAAGLEPAMKAKGPITVVVPRNAALARMDQNVMERLRYPEHKPVLEAIVKMHVLPADFPTSRLVNARQTSFRVATPEGTPVILDVRLLQKDKERRKEHERGPLLIDGNPVVSETKASNGTVYVIDNVLLPLKHRALAPKPGAAAPPAPPAAARPAPPPAPAPTRSPEPEKASKPAAVERSETPPAAEGAAKQP